MTNLLKRLIFQLDSLIPFLELSSEDVFNLIQPEHRKWSIPKSEDTLPDSYEVYQKQVAHAAFLLGYSYSEAFVADLARQIYRNKPQMLPKSKQLNFKDILKAKAYDTVISMMIEKEIHNIFSQSVGTIAKYYKSRFNIEWSEDERKNITIASLIRNCIIHNNAEVNSILAAESKYKEGDTISLKPSDVHTYGLEIRKLARHLYECAKTGILKD